MLISKRQLKKEIASAASSLTDKEVFTSCAFKEYAEALLKGVGKIYSIPTFSLSIIWGGKSEEMEAASTNEACQFSLNANNIEVKDLNRPMRFKVLIGLLCHEVSHRLWTNFAEDLKYQKKILAGRIGLYETRELDSYLTAYPAQRAGIAHTFHFIANSIEDGYIEARFLRESYGYRPYLEAKMAVSRQKALEMYKAQKDSSQESSNMVEAENLILLYAKHYFLPEETTTDAEECIMFLADSIDEAKKEHNSKERTKKYVLILSKLIGFFQRKEEERQQQQESQENEENTEKSSDGGTNENSGGSSCENQSENSEGSGENEESAETSSSGDPNGNPEESSNENQSGDSEDSGENGESTESSSSGGPNGESGDSSTESQSGNSESSGESGDNSHGDSNGGESTPSDLGFGGDTTGELREGSGSEASADFAPLIEGASPQSGDAEYAPPTQNGVIDNSSSPVLEQIEKKVGEEKVAGEIEKQTQMEVNTLKNNMDFSQFHRGISSKIERAGCRETLEFDELDKWSDTILRRLVKEWRKKVKDLQLGEKLNGLYYGKKLSQAHRTDLKKWSSTKAPSDIPNLSVYLYVDLSGSMRGTKAKAAMKTALIIYKFCRELDIRFACYGHSAEHGCDFVKLVSFAEFDTIDNKDLIRIANMESYVGSCNRDGYGLRLCCERLAKESSEKKLMMIISDGAPNDSGYGYLFMSEKPADYTFEKSGNAKCDIVDILRSYRKKGISFLTAGVGEDEEVVKDLYTYGVSAKIAPRYLNISDLDAMPKTFIEILKKQIL